MRQYRTYQTLERNGMRVLLLLLLVLMGSQIRAQIVIGGSVYGGGNQGVVDGNSSVTVYGGDIDRVYGGARMADVKGGAFVHLDGEHASNYMLINHVYGGNDIAGTIGTFKNFLPVTPKATGVDGTWNAFVRVSSKLDPSDPSKVADGNKPIYVGQLYAGGNGDYIYTANNDKYQVTIDGKTYTDLSKPELNKTYLEIAGGSMVYAFGGGNNATVKQNSVIYVNNPSDVVSSIKDTNNPNGGTDGELLTDDRTLNQMGLNPETTYPTSDAFQIGSFFGGNNKAEMAIQPVWHLIDGDIRNIYSGGNEGDMTSPVGLLLEIPANSTIKADNVYGGCRMANVQPKDAEGHVVATVPNPEGYNFPEGLSARVLVRGGDINNVYGGNDITGVVHGGTAVGIYTSIRGDVYGGGNGSYAYTDNPALANDLIWGDFYYDVKSELGSEASSWTFASTNPTAANLDLSVRALNAHRPNVEQTSLRLFGPDADHPIVIGGSVYVGGNSTTLLKSNQTKMVELKIGSNVIADNVFLGNNGANMVDTSTDGVLAKYAGTVKNFDNVDVDFSSLNLTDATTFENYMKGVEMTLMPSVVFDSRAENHDPADYVDYSSYIGSFFCGGNRGSMNFNGLTEINFNNAIVIFDKLVGGCNDAYIPANTGLNAAFEGGLIGTPPADGNDKGTKLKLNISGLKIQPKRWNDNNTELIWNTVDANGTPVTPVTELTKDAGKDYATSSAADLSRRLKGGNIYGGCYTSGHVNGNVVININSTIVERDILFDEVETDELGEEVSLYGSSLLEQQEYHITKRNTGVILGQQGMDVLGKALNVFGGGYGKNTEIWGSTTINLNRGYVFQIFGGSEQGVIGKPDDGDAATSITFNGKTFKYNDAYSCYINLNGPLEGVSKKQENGENMAEAEFIYGGAFLGPIAGNTVINLGNGRIFNSFAGSCNGDILGHTETYIGGDGMTVTGFPYIRDYVYGGNDLGGQILGKADFSGRKSIDCPIALHSEDVTSVSAYMEYTQGRAEGIFGGCFGTYNYKDRYFSDYTNTDGVAINGFIKPRMDNTFVNFRPTLTDELKTKETNVVKSIYGGGQGYPGDGDRDIMQNSSYILIDIPQAMENYQEMEVFGAGAWSGQGMRTYLNPNTTDETALHGVSAIIDLARGHIKAAYGGSFNEGFTRRTMVSVPSGSTIKLNSIFGGAYGEKNEAVCDVYEANVEYHSVDARISYIYGGNNNARRTLYGRVNIDVPVWTNPASTWLGTVYGAGNGPDTWSQYTEVNMLGNTVAAIGGAKAYQVFGGGYNGKVMNKATVKKWAAAYNYPLTIGSTYTEDGLKNPLVRLTELGDTCNTNVRVYKGATIGHDPITKGGYGYGGGQGSKEIPNSGNVNGITYIALLGGTAYRDIYAAGTVGAVLDIYGDELPAEERFTATTNAFIAGGSVRNVYGGGYMGSVGKHEVEGQPEGSIAGATTNDILGATNVVIGIREDQTETKLLEAIRKVAGSSATKGDYGFYCGRPTVQRNAYSGGEGEAEKGGRGGAVFGTANLTLNNGAIGYYYDATVTAKVDGLPAGYVRKIDDETYFENDVWMGEDRLKDYGCMFGGGYSDKSNVDQTNVTIWGGVVRGSVYGGAEVAAVGRGATTEEGAKRTLQQIYKPGGTKVTMYNGHVLRNVYGGGKGYNVLGYGGVNDLYTDGYVFGNTEVYIHGGEIGTREGLAEGYGNVFGGGDVGYVYSKGYFDSQSRTTSTGSPGHTYYYNNNELTEDCKVVVSPYLQIKKNVTEPITWDSKNYYAYDYVPTDYLNTLPAKSNGSFGGGWTNLYTGVNKNVAGATDDIEERGVIIHNAVFAGGNVSSNSDKTYANVTTVYGNTTATLYDVFHRDFITVGTEHIGGIYGGGNLSMVDGYRELNITNYGTDYYGLNQQISLDDYQKLSNRERAYFQLQYVCQTANNNHSPGDKISEEEYNNYNSTYKNETYWKQYGFCSIYAGRLLNTIQRADLCGVFGSRMVLQGAKDRVADVADATAYTINRVGELSLNQRASSSEVHGNYFGIYSLVNHLGNLTSDVRFGDKRQIVENDVVKDAADGKSYYKYKKDNPTNIKRNEGYSLNQVALASGVFLELTTENSTATHKDYGYITGIIELDLINVKQDIVGGGYVYAKNEHRVPKYFDNKKNVILSEYNKKAGDEACSYRQYLYDTSQAGADEWSSTNAGTGTLYDNNDTFGETKVYETSGNFIHRSKTIVDDCYPTNNAYTIGGNPYSEAHYWYIKGSVYVYDQIVSAYTGSANAYSKEVNLPLTINAASNGKLKLLDVKPNKYAYYKDVGQTASIGADSVMVNNESEVYYLNDVISYWDWNLLTPNEQKYFVDMTYVNAVTCKIGNDTYAPGEYVMVNTTGFTSSITYTDDDGNEVTVKSTDTDYDTVKAHVFRPSNDVAHSTGYVLTVDMNNPTDWDNWYSTESNTNYSKISTTEYGALSETSSYIEGPSFKPTADGTYGKKQHTEGEIITKDVYDLYPSGDKAKVDVAYVAKETVTYTYKNLSKTVNKGTAIPYEEWNHADLASVRSYFDVAKVCVSTLKLDDEKYITKGDLLTAADIQTLKDTYAKENGSYTSLARDIDNVLTDAYICKEAGLYGGRSYSTGTNYSAISSWCSLSAADRDKFSFNYDALDLLIDPAYAGNTSLYGTPYSDEKSVGYNATLKSGASPVTYKIGDTNYTVNSQNPTVTSDIYENYITNEKRHYTKLNIQSGTHVFNIAIDNFIYNGTPYAKGQIVDDDIYSNNSSHVDQVTLTGPSTQYYCYEDYTPSTTTKPVEGGSPVQITPLTGTLGSTGSILSSSDYEYLKNDQQYFTIQGTQPTETTTLYVSSDSDIRNVSKKKIITVIYQYTYNEVDDDQSIKTTSELHVVNIHLELESGVPEIGPLAPPSTVLPGATVGLKAPTVSEGLYEVLTSGWELFGSSDDAENHRNGVDFVNNGTPVYWYQNGDNYVAFYAKTYLGKTYSKPVPLSVANYHDLKTVMADKDHHYYIDHTSVDRAPKIYINDYSADEKDGLDLLKDLFTLSTGSLDGHAALNTTKVGACKNLEFILRTDINHSGTWDGIGTDTTNGCFEGTLHGDGHTISGLSQSLFNNLCGEVYNLGVTGLFTTAGIADEGSGYLENCWVKTSEGASAKALFNDPTNTASRTVHLVNCYYPTENGYTAQNGATAKPLQAFYNGEVAYDLNDFYLFKRYSDHNSFTGNDYVYLTDNGGTTLTKNVGHYPDNADGPYLLEDNQHNYVGSYVESRFVDGDFRYADGTIPTTSTIRYWTDDNTKTSGYAPIWPDDYLYFGQTLSYGHVEGRTHQSVPSVINRSDGRVLTTIDGNRVYRAPAYFGSSQMSVAHFNPYAVFAQTKKDDDHTIAYQGMTAIDFAGNNESAYQKGAYSQSVYANIAGGAFYPPLLDDGGLTYFKNVDLTRNLLVYTLASGGTDVNQTPTAAQQTANTVSSVLHDYACVESNDGYRRVAEWDRLSYYNDMQGHWVENGTATRDHFLVDKEDFNCPIVYTMGANKRMWYQRMPDNYVTITNENKTTGWDGICLPFEAELVTTPNKGEITHFYGNSKTGHEYWLREYKGGYVSGNEFVGKFNSIAVGTNKKNYTNTYLWDNYYSHDDSSNTNVDKDKNEDAYQKDYYKTGHEFTDYPYNGVGRPYLVGFPGDSYYEFDLSGLWIPTNRYNGRIENPGPQTITFASKVSGSGNNAVTIGISDTELSNQKVTIDGYTYVPNYVNKMPGVTAYVLDDDGGSYMNNSAGATVSAFRPYIVEGSASGTRGTEPKDKVERVVFENDYPSDLLPHGDPRSLADGTMDIYGKRHKVVVESNLRYVTDVRIVNVAGITQTSFSIEPGETIETRIETSGVYIVYADNGKYVKKVIVK